MLLVTIIDAQTKITFVITDYEDYESEDMENDDDLDRDRGTYEIIIDGLGETSRDGGRNHGGPSPSPGGGAPPPPPREAARSAAVRPCDTSAELFTLQSSRLNTAQPLKGKLTNCHNSGCERLVVKQGFPRSSQIRFFLY